MSHSKRFAPRLSRRAPRAQRGVVMVIVLIALLILMIGGVALIRSADTSMLTAGNLAFKRDMVNQGERGIAKVVDALTSVSGSLSSETTRQTNVLGSNYSAIVLASDARGVPLVLVDSAAFTAAGMSAPDLTDATSGVTIRFVIDRQCTTTGAFDAATCMTSPTASDKAGTSWIKRAGGENRPIYRISVRVIGPRSTEAYLQRTVAF